MFKNYFINIFKPELFYHRQEHVYEINFNLQIPIVVRIVDK